MLAAGRPQTAGARRLGADAPGRVGRRCGAQRHSARRPGFGRRTRLGRGATPGSWITHGAAFRYASPDPEKIDAGGVVRTGSGRSEVFEVRGGPPTFASYLPTSANRRRLVKGSARSAKVRMRSTCSLQKSSSITPPPRSRQFPPNFISAVSVRRRAIPPHPSSSDPLRRTPPLYARRWSTRRYAPRILVGLARFAPMPSGAYTPDTSAVR